MAGLDGYDQWKTASPYDDDPDVLEELEKAIKILEEDVRKCNPLSEILGVMDALCVYTSGPISALAESLSTDIRGWMKTQANLYARLGEVLRLAAEHIETNG